ncbi:MAG: aminomethyltransferase family protein [Pseudomonadota bacterium]
MSTTLDHTHFRRALDATPFLHFYEALSTREHWTAWNGYKVAKVIDNLAREYYAIRSGCSVMDLTPMEKYRIAGQDALRFLNRLVTRDVSQLQIGRVTYALWCDDEGKVIDDGTIFRLSEHEFRLCAQHHQLDWLLTSALGFDVDIACETHEIAALAVQGPTSHTVLAAAGFGELEQLKPFRSVQTSFAGTPALVSRTGFTGDLGYEVWVHPAHGDALWHSLMAQRACLDVVPIGLDAMEMARIEAGFIMPGFDFITAETALMPEHQRSPEELGLGWAVDLSKGPFTGRAALAEERAQPARRRLCKLIVGGNKAVGDAFLYKRRKGREIGVVRCSTWSPVLKANLALAELALSDGALPSDVWAKIDYQRELAWRVAWEPCTITSKPFYSPVHRSATPPAAY